MSNVRVSLAEYAHEAWSGWMRYMFSKCHVNHDGSMVIPKDLVERWTRQMSTPYDELPISERESDIKEANQIMDIVTNHVQPFIPLG